MVTQGGTETIVKINNIKSSQRGWEVKRAHFMCAFLWVNRTCTKLYIH